MRKDEEFRKDVQKIELTNTAACEAIVWVLERSDFNKECYAEIAYRIAARLGFKLDK